MDAYLIRKTQEGYLWLLDNTGVYCATVRMVLIFTWMSPDLIRKGLTPFLAFMIVLWGVAKCMEYKLQDDEKYERFNDIAEGWEDNLLRRYLFWPLVVAAMCWDYRRGYYWDVPADLIFLVWSYLECCRIREREPPVRGLAYDGV